MDILFDNADVKRHASLVKELISTDKYACVITFGCQQNEADSEKLRGMLIDMGYSLTDDPSIADLIAVNTCAIRQHAEEKALSMLGRFKRMKDARPEMIIAVVGCMAAEPHVADMLKKDFHYVSFTLEPSMLHRFPEAVYDYLSIRKRSFVFGTKEYGIAEGINSVRLSDHRAWVSIMYGCNNYCSYCIVPYVRGRERSRSSQSIIKECEDLVKKGYKEITLLGQNVNSYRADLDFASLLEKIANIAGDFIIRFMTSHPKDVSDSLIEVMGKYNGKIAPYFHLPLQSGSDRILKAMNRTYDIQGFLRIVEKLRKSVPSIALSSDVIVGFPSESEQDFEDTLSVLQHVEFDMVYAFIYSRREGTRAALMDDQIPDEIKSARMARLLDLQCDISLRKNKPYVGKEERVLVDSRDRKDADCYIARTLTNKLVHFTADTNCVGEFKNVKISRAGAFDLFGEDAERN